jgi:hypothetical protein
VRCRTRSDPRAVVGPAARVFGDHDGS